jgi:excisionase family DNA binding protein
MIDRESINPESPPLINIREAAQLLAISVRHLQRLTVAGDFEALKLGRAVRYRRSDILEHIGTTRVGSQGMPVRGVGQGGRRPGAQRRKWAKANRPSVG